MDQTAAEDPGTGLSADALREWAGHVDCVLRGVAHALNNRAASVAAVHALAAEPDQGVASIRALLIAEVERLRDLADVVRAVGVPRGDVDAFEPRDALPAARAALALHAELRDRPIVIESAVVPPVRAARWMFGRALIAVAARAAAAASPAEPVTVQVTEEGGRVVVRASGPAAARSAYADELARVMGGEPLTDAPGFRLPTLAALRRREGR